MIIVLPGADFSQNNIGQVEVNAVLNDFTKAAILASGNSTLTNIQKSAVETFFRKLGAFGNESQIWSKLSYVYMPFLSADLAHSMVNYVGNDATLVPDDTEFALRNKGITGASSTKHYLTNTLSSGMPLQDFSAFFMTMEAEDVTTINLFYLSPGQTANRMTLGYTKASNGNMVQNVFYSSTAKTNFVFNDSITGANGKKLGGVSVYGTTVSELLSSGVINTETLDVPEQTSTNKIRLFADTSNGINNTCPSIGFIALGSHLTAEEIGILKEASETLRDILIS